ncbi:MAG: hypothetical protein ACRCZS_14835 [Chroococcidiopsis sp.]
MRSEGKKSAGGAEGARQFKIPHTPHPTPFLHWSLITAPRSLLPDN